MFNLGLTARFAAVRVRIANGAPQRIGSAGAQHMPGEEAWLVGEHRSNGERKYYLSNLPADIPIKAFDRRRNGTPHIHGVTNCVSLIFR